MKSAGKAVKGFAESAGGKLGAAANPLVAAARASAESLNYVYGPVLKRAAGGVKFLTDWGRALGSMYGGPVLSAFARLGGGLATVASGAMRFGGAVARIGLQVTTAGLNLMGRALGGVVSATREAVNHLGRLGAIAAVGVGIGLGKVVMAASNVAEAMNKTRQEFGADADLVVAEATRMSKAFGISKVATLDMAGAFGGMFRGAGMTSKKSAELSAQFAVLAHNTESYYNLAKGEAAQKIMSGLAGEIRPLREIGVLIDDNKVKAQAYAMGLAEAGTEVSQEAKVLARIPLLLAGLGKAQGDRARTATDVANATREVQGRVESLAETIGQTLEPITKRVLGDMGTGLGALQMLWNDNQNQVSAWAGATVSGTGTAVESIGFVQRAIGFIADGWQVVGLGFSAAQSYITAGLGKLVGALGKLDDALVAVIDFIPGVEVKGSSMFKTWSEDLKNLSGEQWKGFTDDLAKGPPSEKIDEFFARAKAQVDSLRGDILKTPAVIPPTVGHGLAEVGKKKEMAEYKSAGATEMGSAAAYSAIVQARGQQSQTVNNRIDQNTKSTAEATGRAATTLARMADMMTQQASQQAKPGVL